jgi:hypothetical protein
VGEAAIRGCHAAAAASYTTSPPNRAAPGSGRPLSGSGTTPPNAAISTRPTRADARPPSSIPTALAA